MHHAARLSRPDIEIGAGLLISGNSLQGGDLVVISIVDDQQILASVAAFALAGLSWTSAQLGSSCSLGTVKMKNYPYRWASLKLDGSKRCDRISSYKSTKNSPIITRDNDCYRV